MKFGAADYGMLVWDGGNYDFQQRLEDLKSIGHDGIERLECIDAANGMYKAAACRGSKSEATDYFIALKEIMNPESQDQFK